MNDFTRFWEKVQLSPDGCWIWIAGKFKDGYGSFYVDAHTIHAHRWIWQQFNGPMPDGLEMHHTCGMKTCVNPAHLIAVTRKEHQALTIPAVRTHCKNGHPFTHVSGGTKRCRICARVHGRKSYYKLRVLKTPVKRTHCKNGHPFDSHNGHQQVCSICGREAAKRHYWKRKAA